MSYPRYSLNGWRTAPATAIALLLVLVGLLATSSPEGVSATLKISLAPLDTSSSHLPAVSPTACAGRWDVVPSPNRGQHNMFYSTQFAGANDGWVVGDYSPVTGGPVRTLTEHWDGSAWSIIPSPNPSSTWNQLRGLSILSSTDVWAAGTTSVSASRNELVLHWDGQAWAQSSTPGTQSNTSELTDIVAIAPNDVWAVGYYYISGYRPYALHWNGATWTHHDMPMIGGRFHFLQSVVALSPNNVWAVGYTSSGFQGAQFGTLIEHWDGASWDLVPSPNPGALDSVLFGVSAAPDGSAMWAAGWYRDSSSAPSHTFIARWNGTSWSTVPSPDAGAGNNESQYTLALSDSDVWVVGGYQAVVGGQQRTLVMHWDGTAWTFVPSDSPGSGNNSLNTISAGGDTLWAAGRAIDANGTNTLIERYNNCPISTPIPPSTSTSTLTPMPTSTSTNTVTPIPTNTSTSTSTPTLTNTSTNTETSTPNNTLTSAPTDTATATPTMCNTSFEDVPSGSPFYSYVRCLACFGIISGYDCGGAGEPCNPYGDPYFRVGNNVTRGQAAKFISNGKGYDDPIPAGQQTFADVPIGSAFWVYIERVAMHGAIGGYACGGPGEPCDAQQSPYYRPYSNMTRGQLAKIDANVADYTDPVPSNQQTFRDVPTSNTFWLYVERAYMHGVIGGYPCGGSSEPCPGTYFRPYNSVTRGQTAKIIANTFFPDCQSR